MKQGRRIRSHLQERLLLHRSALAGVLAVVDEPVQDARSLDHLVVGAGQQGVRDPILFGECRLRLDRVVLDRDDLDSRARELFHVALQLHELRPAKVTPSQ